MVCMVGTVARNGMVGRDVIAGRVGSVDLVYRGHILDMIDRVARVVRGCVHLLDRHDGQYVVREVLQFLKLILELSLLFLFASLKMNDCT